jgi:hypothetical protein
VSQVKKIKDYLFYILLYRNSELSVNLFERALLEATREANETTRPEDIHDLPGTYSTQHQLLFQLLHQATHFYIYIINVAIYKMIVRKKFLGEVNLNYFSLKMFQFCEIPNC